MVEVGTKYFTVTSSNTRIITIALKSLFMLTLTVLILGSTNQILIVTVRSPVLCWCHWGECSGRWTEKLVDKGCSPQTRLNSAVTCSALGLLEASTHCGWEYQFPPTTKSHKNRHTASSNTLTTLFDSVWTFIMGGHFVWLIMRAWWNICQRLTKWY